MRRDARELAVVDHLRVDLVREHPGAAVREKRRGRLRLLGRERAARRVLGRVEDDELRPRAQARLEVGDIEREVALLEQRQRDRRGARPADRRLVDREARVGVDDLIARIARRENREEEERLGAGPDEHVRRIDGNAS
jgi:hypothetical protein